MQARFDVAVVGGGVIGLTSAYYLAREGLRVGIFDRQALGQEASWAAAGILPPAPPHATGAPIDQLQSLSGREFPGLSEELRDLTGIDNGYHRCGGLEFLRDSGGVDEWRSEGVETRELAEEECRRLEPALAVGVGAAIELPGLAQLRNPRHLKALIAACGMSGRVTMAPDTAVQRLIVRNGHIEALDTTTGRVEADQFLIASGAWTEALLEPLGCRIDVQPVRGQMVLLQCAARPFRRVLLSGSRYLVPRDDGRVLAGSTMEHAGFDKGTTASALRDLLQLACELVPALANAPLERAWAGLRPGSRDGLPYIGPVPGIDNLFVAAGHFRAGIQLSPGTAVVLKEWMLGRKPSVPMHAFRLER